MSSDGRVSQKMNKSFSVPRLNLSRTPERKKKVSKPAARKSQAEKIATEKMRYSEMPE
jgi:hypothetical protein